MIFSLARTIILFETLFVVYGGWFSGERGVKILSFHHHHHHYCYIIEGTFITFGFFSFFATNPEYFYSLFLLFFFIINIQIFWFWSSYDDVVMEHTHAYTHTHTHRITKFLQKHLVSLSIFMCIVVIIFQSFFNHSVDQVDLSFIESTFTNWNLKILYSGIRVK